MFTLPRAAGFAAALCTALALTTPAFALGAKVQQGAAVKFPKGLKWEPMEKVVVSSSLNEEQCVAIGTTSLQERSMTIAQWEKEISQNPEWVVIASKQLKQNDVFYFVTAHSNSGCRNTVFRGQQLPTCKTKIVVSHDASLSSPSSINAGTICMKMGNPDVEPDGTEEPYAVLRPEIAFDANNQVIYVRQRFWSDYPKACYRKITLTP